jgi:hypothetical protein
MKNRLKLLVILGLFLPVFAATPLIVLAQEDTTQEQTTQSEEDTTTKREELEARLEERKAALNTRLTFARQARIKNFCKASQGKLSSIGGRIKGLETSRAQVYENLLSRLTRLSEKLKTHDVDTAEFDAQITELTVMIETFNTNLESYKQAVDDLANMDCATDTEGFQASLEAARTERAETAESSKAIRTFLSDTVKPTLKELRQQFADNADSTNQTENNETEGGENE